MNRHTRLAIVLAPFLLVGGYVASDQYMEYKANEPKVFQLVTQDECNIQSGKCILESGELLVSISDEDGITKVNTSFPVDSVMLSLVHGGSKETIYGLDMAQNPQYWEKQTDIRLRAAGDDPSEKLRVVVKMKGSIYLSEVNLIVPPVQ